MLCDDCMKRNVCKYAEQCRILERSMKDNRIEDIIKLKVSCNEFMSETDYITLY